MIQAGVVARDVSCAGSGIAAGDGGAVLSAADCRAEEKLRNAGALRGAGSGVAGGWRGNWREGRERFRGRGRIVEQNPRASATRLVAAVQREFTHEISQHIPAGAPDVAAWRCAAWTCAGRWLVHAG